MKRESMVTNTEKLLFEIWQESIKQTEQLRLITESLLNKKEESFNTDVEDLLNKFEPTEMILENKVLEKDSNDNFNDNPNDNVDKRSEKSEIKVNEKANESKKTYPCKYCGGEHERPVDIATCAKKQKRKGDK